jgi:hypothetical protein
MDAFSIFRRVWSALLLAILEPVVLLCMYSAIKKRRRLPIIQRGVFVIISELLCNAYAGVALVTREYAVTSGDPTIDVSGVMQVRCPPAGLCPGQALQRDILISAQSPR